MRVELQFPGHPSADAYLLDDGTEQAPWCWSLEDAIQREADNVLSEANSDHLEEPSDECYERLRERVVREATAALVEPGDRYRDPIGVVWQLVAVLEPGDPGFEGWS